MWSAWIVSVNAKVMKKDHCHNNIFRIMKFAFTFFANQMPPTLQHTICSNIVSLKNLVILNKKHSNNPFFNLTFCSVYCISSHCICLIFFVTLAPVSASDLGYYLRCYGNIRAIFKIIYLY